MTGDKIGVEMRQENMLDLKLMLRRKGQILVYVALRIHNGCSASLFISD